MMSQREFALLVEAVRAAQRRYFLKRDNLKDCKVLEQQVDEEVKLQLAPTLFELREEARQ